MDYLKITDAMKELAEEELLSLMNQIAGGEGDAVEALEACQKGMDEVGTLFEEGEYFVGDLIYAGEMMTEAVERIKPLLKGEETATYGRMILATVKDDLHDIGKNIVKIILEAGGFEVLDLGTDADPKTIVETAKKEHISIVALSGVLTLSLESMKQTVEEFQKEGIREQVKICIGGAPVSESASEKIGADAWAKSPQKTLSVCRAWAVENA